MKRYLFTAIAGPAACLIAIWLSACVSEDTAGEGSLTLEISGGAALREGFPLTEGNVTYAFADGWEVDFDKYIFTITDTFFSEQEDGSELAGWEGPKIMDLAVSATGSEELATIEGLPARRLDFGFTIVAPTTMPAESSAAAEDIQLMINNGWSALITGTAVHPETERTIDFRFGIPMAARYYECINGKDATRGIALEANKTIGAFIYPHAIHLFWDTLSTGDEDMRFEAFAAVAGDDNFVTEEELLSQDLTDLRDADGDPLVDSSGQAVVYNDGGLLPPNEWTLYHFVKRQLRESFHFNGIGLCKVESLE
ncbi:MAG: hypothetical protein JXX29_00645 [Deltaproteobacteria bacterium]|nr:hypothetical protein [Deltaproteobacteria bacterium]MBN2670145.1 hypothetical protein [Deltaproteobacteria bacterium]